MAENKNVYINSFDASDIYEHQLGRSIKSNMVGMVAYSNELIKLKDFGFKTYLSKTNKNRSNDIINLKFNKSVWSADKLLEKYPIEQQKEYLLSLGEDVDTFKTKTEQKKHDFKIAEAYKRLKYLERAENEDWDKMSRNDLRLHLYIHGFTYNGVEYVVYKRTSAKSRTGQCQFIKKSIRDKAVKWARLGMNVEGMSLKDGIDFPSLLAYESLQSSSIIEQIRIDTKNIFIISDVISKFTTKANVIKNGEDGKLISDFVENHNMESDLFDGQGLLDEMYFPNGKGSMLLRHHMFKCNPFNAGVQRFLKDMCPKDISYEEWQLEDMFGDIHYAKDIHLITTPNSIKSLKFYKRKTTKGRMYQHWKKKVEADDCMFGICKYEKQSKRGYSNGKILNQLSYQLINSMPYSEKEISDLIKFELGFIDNLKNNEREYLDYLLINANEMNSNQMLYDIYEKNNNLSNTSIFKQKKERDINSYINKVKSGKVRVIGDYCTICQNPKEMLYHTIGKLPVIDGVLQEDMWKNKQELIYNQAYTTLHPFKGKYASFRNPHTSPSNVLILENIESNFISIYMNPSKNIIYTNAIGFEINRILSGQDCDSDTLLMVDNKTVLDIAKRCFGEYNVCDNMVDSMKMDYAVSHENMAKIDNILSTSQGNIGEVVNLGQHCMSAYWDEIRFNGKTERSKQLLKYVDICTILSEIAIDMAKKMYDVDFKKQVEFIKKDMNLDKKPLFFKYISKNKKPNLSEYYTPMDLLNNELDCIKRANKTDTLDFLKIIDEHRIKSLKKNKRQLEKVELIIEEYLSNRKKIYIDTTNEIRKDGGVNTSEIIRSRNDRIDEAESICRMSLNKYKLNKETMLLVIKKIFDSNSKSRERLTIMNILYKINRDEFLSLFK